MARCQGARCGTFPHQSLSVVVSLAVTLLLLLLLLISLMMKWKWKRNSWHGGHSPPDWNSSLHTYMSHELNLISRNSFIIQYCFNSLNTRLSLVNVFMPFFFLLFSSFLTFLTATCMYAVVQCKPSCVWTQKCQHMTVIKKYFHGLQRSNLNNHIYSLSLPSYRSRRHLFIPSHMQWVFVAIAPLRY